MIAAKFGFDDTSNVKTMRKKNSPFKKVCAAMRKRTFSKCYVFYGYKTILSLQRIQQT